MEGGYKEGGALLQGPDVTQATLNLGMGGV